MQDFKGSHSWVSDFKKRNGIRVFRLHGQGGSADSTFAAVAQNVIPVLLRDTDTSDVYNCDETGYFYKASPNKTLATTARQGTAGSKERITAILCCNASGSVKLPIWIIGRSKKPQCFGVWKPEHEGVLYRANKKAWNNRELFKEYVNWFNRKMMGNYGTQRDHKKAWLLLDNSSTHYVDGF
jgi:hypothetical protein